MRKLLAIFGGALAILLVFAMAFGWAGVSFDMKDQSNGVVAVTSLFADDDDSGDDTGDVNTDTNSPDTDSTDSGSPDSDTDPDTDSPSPSDTDSP